MHKLQVNDYVKWTDRDGETCTGRVLSIGAKFARVEESPYWMEERLSVSRLTYLPRLVLGHEEYRRIVRLEGDDWKCLAENDPHNVVNADNVDVTVEDLLFAVERLADGMDIGYTVWAWIDFVQSRLRIQAPRNGMEIYTDVEVMKNMMAYTYHAFTGLGKKSTKENLAEVLLEGRTFLEDVDKAYMDRRYPLYIKERLLMDLENDDEMEQASEEQILLYRAFAEELANVGNRYGLEAVGYGCYGGNRAFDCDWFRSRDCITELFENPKETSKREFHANTLGYIYYYGRCNGGVPEYEKAYRYFSFAAFNGVYEARYKIADMYQNGYGVVQSKETADNIICDLYEENLKYIRDGIFNCKFADVALRMGNRCIDREYEEEKDYDVAMYYYTQAAFAIRMRMLEANYYGDGKVCDAISSAIEKVKEATGFRTKKSVRYDSLTNLLDKEVVNGRKLDLTVKKTGNLTYRMTFRPHQNAAGSGKRRLFLTVPEIGLCGMLDKLSVTYKARTALDERILDRTLVVDALGYDRFLYDGKRLFKIDGWYVLRNNEKKNGRIYRFASVRFGSGRRYDYLCEDPEITVGDRVLVDASGEEQMVIVCNIFEKCEGETALPLKAYKKVIKKM